MAQNLNPPLTNVKLNESHTKDPGISNMCLGIATSPEGTDLMPSHLDEDLLTITFYDEPFLEVLDRDTEEWKLVETCEGMPIVNVGETFQNASGGRLHAPWHRVKMTPNHIDLVMYDFNEGLE